MKFFGFFISVLFLSCAQLPKKPEGPLKLTEVPGLPPHIYSMCEIYDLSGKLLRDNGGRFCLYEGDGTTYMNRPGLLAKYDRHFKVLWQRPVQMLHHQFSRSVFDDTFLALESEVDFKGPKNVRSDVIMVLNKTGKTIKSVRFAKIVSQLKKMGIGTKRPLDTHWFDGKIASGGKENLEMSHVNSFAEIYENRHGRNIRTGYVVHCNYYHKIIFLDDSLQKVTGFIDTSGRSIHDVKMLNPQKLIFYQNHHTAAAVQHNSSVQTYDLLTRSFAQLYSGNSASLSSVACSSVQALSESRLLLTHSNCIPSPDTVKLTTLEYIDLETGQHAVLTFDVSRFINDARLLDLTDYLKNNQGP